MDVPIADDYAGIAQRLREISREKQPTSPAPGWGIWFKDGWIGWSGRTWHHVHVYYEGATLTAHWPSPEEAKNAILTLGTVMEVIKQAVEIKPYDGP